MEPHIGQTLVRYSAEKLKPIIIEEKDEPESELLSGYRLKIVDGNHLGATEHRLEPLRSCR